MFRSVTLGCALGAVLGCASLAGAQGGNDCASPQSVVATSAVTVVTVDTNPATTQGHHASCDMISGTTWYNSVDVWYLYTALNTGMVEMRLSGCSSTITSSTASNLSVWASCGSSSSTACSRTACNSSVTFPVTAGGTYLVRAATFAISSSVSSVARKGTATLTFTELEPPVNDTCLTASEVGAGTFNWNDTLAAADGPLPPCCNTADQATQKDVWYAYTAATNGVVVMTSTGAWISVHDNCAETTTYACASGSITAYVTGGTRYLVRVARPAGSTGAPGSLVITEYAAPANETCATAEEITAGSVVWNDSGATADGPFASCGLGSTATQRDVWFAYTATVDGNAAVDCRRTANAAPGTNTDATIAVFTGCAGTEIACTSSSATRRWLCFPVTSGQRYLVRVGRAATSVRESWTLRIQENPTPAGDSCATATALTLGTQAYSNTGVCDVDPFEGAQTCFGSSGLATSWFVMTPDTDGIAVFDTTNGGNSSVTFDTVMYAYDGSCGGPLLTCSDNLCHQYSTGSYIAIPARQGVPIYLRLDVRTTGNNYYTPFNIKTDLVDKYGNDECSGAASLVAGVHPAFSTTTYDNRNASDSAGVADPTCNNGDNLGLTRHDLWWTWTPAQNGTARLSTCRNPAPLLSADASVVTIYRDCTLAQQVDCNNDVQDRSDINWAYPCTDEQSAMQFSVTAGNSYLIRIASHREWIGPGVINFSFEPAPCLVDFNHDNIVSIDDLFLYFNAYFMGASTADFNGVGGVTIDDLFLYINAYFTGC